MDMPLSIQYWFKLALTFDIPLKGICVIEKSTEPVRFLRTRMYVQVFSNFFYFQRHVTCFDKECAPGRFILVCSTMQL